MKRIAVVLLALILSGLLISIKPCSSSQSRSTEAVTPELIWDKDVVFSDGAGNHLDGITYVDWLVSYHIYPEKFLEANGNNISFIMSHFNFSLMIGNPVETLYFQWTNWGTDRDYWYINYFPDSVGSIDWTLKILNLNDTGNAVTYNGTLTVYEKFEVSEDFKDYYYVYEDTGFDIDLTNKISRDVKDYYIWWHYTDNILIVREIGFLKWNVSLKQNATDIQRSFEIILNDTYCAQIRLEIVVYIHGVNDRPEINGITVTGGCELTPEISEHTWIENGENVTETRRAVSLEIPERWPNPIEFNVNWTEIETYKENMMFNLTLESDKEVEIERMSGFIGTFRIRVLDGVKGTIWFKLKISDNGRVNERIDYGEENIPLSDEIWIRVDILERNDPPLISNVEIDRTSFFIDENITITLVGEDPEGDGLTAKWWINEVIQPNVNLSLETSFSIDYWRLEEIERGIMTKPVNIRFRISDGEYWTDEDHILLNISLKDEDLSVNPPEFVELKSSAQKIKEGETLTLVAAGIDSDKDELTYTWNLKDDPSINWTGKEITVTDLEPGGHVFEVTISDGKYSVKDYLYIQVEKKESAKSNNSGLIILLIIILVIIILIAIGGALLFFFVFKRSPKEEDEEKEEPEKEVSSTTQTPEVNEENIQAIPPPDLSRNVGDQQKAAGTPQQQPVTQQPAPQPQQQAPGTPTNAAAAPPRQQPVTQQPAPPPQQQIPGTPTNAAAAPPQQQPVTQQPAADSRNTHKCSSSSASATTNTSTNIYEGKRAGRLANPF